MATTTPTLDDRVRALLKELRDMVLEYKIAIDYPPASVVSVTNSYKPPTPLAIDRSSRGKFAPKYYGDAATTFRSPRHCFTPWIESLEVPHQRLFRSVHCVVKKKTLVPGKVWQTWANLLLLPEVQAALSLELVQNGGKILVPLSLAPEAARLRIWGFVTRL